MLFRLVLIHAAISRSEHNVFFSWLLTGKYTGLMTVFLLVQNMLCIVPTNDKLTG